MERVHISSAFDEDLERIQSDLMRMGGIVEKMITDAARALERRDADMAAEVIAADREVDRLEEAVDQEVVRVLALRQPQARDLRTVIAVMRIAGNLERIGDYAKNIAKRTAPLFELPPVGTSAGSLRRMAGEVGAMLKDALDSFLRADADLAESVRLRDEDVDQMYNALFREFLTHMMEDPRNISPCMHLLFIAKNLERIGDHVTNIAEQTVYMATGRLPGDERPKRDITPTEAIGPDDAKADD
ncbi:MAG: phosphate transport system regulatory protein PhoU [Alphaproteobacteria bacterium]|nr:MAG: phosphate transport system regulatory protein PhoU [Alphaproteobacteria bacterium]